MAPFSSLKDPFLWTEARTPALNTQPLLVLFFFFELALNGPHNVSERVKMEKERVRRGRGQRFRGHYSVGAAAELLYNSESKSRL